jgi:hypothetical protein
MISFIIISSLIFICDFIDRIELVPIIYIKYYIYALFFFAAVIIGNLTITDKRFDYLMALMLPIAVYSTLFVALLFDEGCDGNSQFSLEHALNIEYYIAWGPLVVMMTATTFLASFKSIRIIRIIERIRAFDFRRKNF